MASIIKRNNNFCVVYSYKDANGTPKQKWETFTDLSDAKNRKKRGRIQGISWNLCSSAVQNPLTTCFLNMLPSMEKANGHFQPISKHCTDCQLHSSAHRLDEAAGYRPLV